MKFTQVAADAFQKLQLNAGVLLKSFNPATGELDRSNIFAATSGGVSFTAAPEYIDYGEDIDNVPANTMELKKQQSVEVKLSGTAKTVDTATGKTLIGACDVDGNKLTPRVDLLAEDFSDIWWVGDYSDKNDDATGGFLAIHVLNALNTGGFSIKSNDDGKADIDFEFTGHYSLDDITVVPFEMFIESGGSEPQPTADATLSALTIGSLTLAPVFSPTVYEYTTTTTNASNTVTATATDSAATVAITLNGTEMESGSSAYWDEGENSIVVTVSNTSASAEYEVTVTKE